MTFLAALILAIVEGITEFLPISSTGHMIIASSFLNLTDIEFAKLFVVNIQFGAILSVVVLYWKQFFKSMDFYYKLFVAFIPAAVFGFLLNDYIDMMLENVIVVAFSLLIGGVILVFIDKWFNNVNDDANEEIKYKQAFFIGLFQVIAMIPGVSRSAATIIGGMAQKFSRKKAAEFSFFLAVPTMCAASGYKMLDNYEAINFQNIPILIFGNIIAFIVALIAIKGFITFLTKYGFKVFGYYRIIVGLIILISYFLGFSDFKIL
ncbi:MAG: undecaprenyl-diphosphatase UppP [Bacteroidetes bacterium GWE2_29_8]|nr:MAG: undecaprenyl-diphosphatase UppP [Bacteroidetes bacterium GWE2_29_8]OFY16480.1 MAG: undecaprenyl-diphosphatase UppP [Bacteroidetes bacterium GWF2_29_10]